MRRIDLTPYKINLDGRGDPVETVKAFMAMPQVAILKRLATERLGISEDNFNTIVTEEVIKAQPDDQGVQTLDYDIRGSLVEILFHPNLGLGAKDILDRDTLARKIKDHPDNDLLLEEEEYKKVVAGVNALSGLGRKDVEFCRRVLNAPQVEVQAKPTEAQPAAK